MLKYEMNTLEYSESELVDVKKWYLIDSTKNKFIAIFKSLLSGTISLTNLLSFIIKIKSLFGRVLYNQFTSLFKSAS